MPDISLIRKTQNGSIVDRTKGPGSGSCAGGSVSLAGKQILFSNSLQKYILKQGQYIEIYRSLAEIGLHLLSDDSEWKTNRPQSIKFDLDRSLTSFPLIAPN